MILLLVALVAEGTCLLLLELMVQSECLILGVCFLFSYLTYRMVYAALFCLQLSFYDVYRVHVLYVMSWRNIKYHKKFYFGKKCSFLYFELFLTYLVDTM